jgi:uncharacterized alkaline shock family protein YloU
MEGNAVISHDVLASYAADAALAVDGVDHLVDGPRRDRGVRVTEAEGVTSVALYVAVAWGAAAPDVASAIQTRVRDYLRRTARLTAVTVDVVVTGVAASDR